MKHVQDTNFKQPKLLSQEKSLTKMYFVQWNNMQQLKARGRSTCIYINKPSRYCYKQKAG